MKKKQTSQLDQLSRCTGWQVTLCDPIWHVSSRSDEASCELLYSCYLYVYLTGSLGEMEGPMKSPMVKPHQGFWGRYPLLKYDDLLHVMLL